MTDKHCPRCGLDSVRHHRCTDPSCDWPTTTTRD